MNYFIFALQFLTRIPVRPKGELAEKGYSRAMIFFPLIGLFIGLLLACVFNLSILFLTKRIAEAFVIIASIFITGALHFDGLADTCDGVYGGRGDKKKALGIMKQSCIGTMGGLALSLDILLRFAALDSLPVFKIPAAVIVMAVLGRWAQVLFTFGSAPAAYNSTAGYFSKALGLPQFIAATLIMIAITLFFAKPLFLIALVVIMAALILLFRGYCKAKLGGITGDTIGAVNEIVEVLVLIVYSAAGTQFITA